MAEPQPPPGLPPPSTPLPWDDVPDSDHPKVTLPAHTPKFRITIQRMIQYGSTDGCPACEAFEQRGHTPECRERFRSELLTDGALTVHHSTDWTPIPDLSGPAPEAETDPTIQEILDLFGPDEVYDDTGARINADGSRAVGEDSVRVLETSSGSLPVPSGEPTLLGPHGSAEEERITETEAEGQARSGLGPMPTSK